MKNKIALLLAFSMLLSILPMNVFAAIYNPLPFSGNTGSLDERNLGPASNVRNWGDGVVVATNENISKIFGADTTKISSIVTWDNNSYASVVAAPTGNLRHIVVSPRYFLEMNQSLETWGQALPEGYKLGRWAGNPATFVEDRALMNTNLPILATNITVDIHNVEMWLNRSAAIGSDTVRWFGEFASPKSSGSTRDMFDFWDWLDETRTTDDAVDVMLESIHDGGTGSVMSALESTYLAALYFDNYLDITFTDVEDTRAVELTPEQVFDYFQKYVQSSEARKKALDSINAALGHVNSGNNAVAYSDWFAADYDSGIRAGEVQNNITSIFAQPDVQMSVSLVTVSDSRSQLLLARNARMDDNWIRNHGSNWYVSVPIEYLTNGDTNDNPVYLTFQEQGGWPQAGEQGKRTDLTTVSDHRFEVSLDGDPRAFHRYGRADIEPIRIAEAAQSAFDRQNWWVEVEVLTNGFFWASQSTSTNIIDDFETRYQRDNETAATNTSTDIRPLTLLNGSASFDRTPDTGANRYTILSFPISLEGQANPSRFVNDWFQVSGLSIAADDRARPGNVEVEVRLYTAEAGMGTSNGTWHWNPNRVQETDANGNFTGNYIPGTSADIPWPNNSTQNATVTNMWPSAQYNAPSESGDSVYGTLRYDSPNTTATNATANGWWTWIASPTGGSWYGRLEERNDPIFDDTLVVARYGEIGLELFLHPDDTLPELRTGMQQWDFDYNTQIGVGSTFGSVEPRTADDIYHKTARAVLRERVPGSLPATGAHPTTFTFNEGIQILGARMWTNDTAFITEHNDKDDYIWFGQNSADADNFLNGSIIGNKLTIRPEIGEISNDERVRRYEEAEITAEFYISILAGYEYLINEEIELTVASGTVEAPFEEVLPVAYAWDPITLSTTHIDIDDVEEAAFGVIRNVPINDVTVTETRAGTLLPGEQVWVGVEGGISRGWNNADTISIGAVSARVVGDSTMEIGPVVMDSHGMYVDIRRGSNTDGAQIVFEDVSLSGRVVPEQDYSIIAAGSGIADNWSEFLWLGTGSNTGLSTRGTIHGFFPDEPYPTPAFKFLGSDQYTPPGAPIATPPPVDTTTPPSQQTPPPPLIQSPVTIRENDTSFNSIREPGTVIPGAPLILLPNDEDPTFSTSYVKFTVVADLLGVEGNWDEPSRSATFSNGHTTVVVTDGSNMATVTGPDGVPTTRQIRTSVGSAARPAGLFANAKIIDNYFYVPISFFSSVVPEFPIGVTWVDGARGFRSIIVSPRMR